MMLGLVVISVCSSPAASAASLDCALNGIKAADGRCACDPAWEGAQCEYNNFDIILAYF